MFRGLFLCLCFVCCFLLLFCFAYMDSYMDCVKVRLLSFVAIQCDGLACFSQFIIARTNLCYDLAKATKASDGKKKCHDQDKKVQEASFWVRFLHLKLI